jgi:uncharacterized protein (TIGR03435 family)
VRSYFATRDAGLRITNSDDLYPRWRSKGDGGDGVRSFFCLVLLSLAGASSASTQSRLTFEVATIKQAGDRGLIATRIDGAFAKFTRASLRGLISRAYGVQYYQVSGPDWMTHTFFDINAKLPSGSSPKDLPEMLQSLLEDRCGLTLHRQMREFSVYAMTVAKDGSKLIPLPDDPDEPLAPRALVMTLSDYAAYLSVGGDRPVVDETGIEGEYQFSFRLITLVGGRGGTGPLPAVQPYGLQLEPRKATLPVLVIDHIERTPSEN